jgi:hypothetical protein
MLGRQCILTLVEFLPTDGNCMCTQMLMHELAGLVFVKPALASHHELMGYEIVM